MVYIQKDSYTKTNYGISNKKNKYYINLNRVKFNYFINNYMNMI